MDGWIDWYMDGLKVTNVTLLKYIFCFVFHFIRSIPKVNLALIIL